MEQCPPTKEYKNDGECDIMLDQLYRKQKFSMMKESPLAFKPGSSMIRLDGSKGEIELTVKKARPT